MPYLMQFCSKAFIFQNFCQVAADPMSMQYERAAHFSKLHPTTDLTLQVRDIFFLGAFFFTSL